MHVCLLDNRQKDDGKKKLKKGWLQKISINECHCACVVLVKYFVTDIITFHIVQTIGSLAQWQHCSSLNNVTIQAWLVLGWATIFGQVQHFRM